MSRMHPTLDPEGLSAAKYWNFGADEIAREDIPAFVNEILTTR